MSVKKQRGSLLSDRNRGKARGNKGERDLPEKKEEGLRPCRAGSGSVEKKRNMYAFVQGDGM